MKFDYFKLPLPKKSDFFGHSILKPIIPVKIGNGSNQINYAVLVDSGADFCIFDAEIGEAIGLDIKAGPSEIFGGIQERGGSTAYFHKISIEVGGLKYNTVAGFSYDIAKHGHGILGQKGFFDMFSVKFEYDKERIEITTKK